MKSTQPPPPSNRASSQRQLRTVTRRVLTEPVRFYTCAVRVYQNSTVVRREVKNTTQGRRMGDVNNRGEKS